MAINIAELEMCENIISDLIYGKTNVGKVEAVLSTGLSKCAFHGKTKKFTVTIVKSNRSKEPFFGARVYPSIDMMQRIIEDTVVECKPFKELHAAWGDITDWVIELDSSMFDRTIINLVPKEIMAAILHEIGHTVYSGMVIERFWRCYKSMQAHMKCAEKDAIRLGYALFMVPLSVSCGIRSWTRGRNAIKEEFYADKMVREAGYGDFYYSLLSKIIEAYGNAMVDENETASDNRVSERCRWAALNIVDATRRRTKLGNDLFMDSAKTPSDYVKALSARVLTAVGINMRERYSGDAVESWGAVESMIVEQPDLVMAKYQLSTNTDRFRTWDDAIECRLHQAKYTKGTAAFEAFGKKVAKNGLPSWLDIDRIQIEIDRITNHHDRAFVLEMIYSKMDEIQTFMEFTSDNPQLARRYEAEAKRMIDTLEGYREQVLARNNFASRYKVFVKYPEGYEG